MRSYLEVGIYEHGQGNVPLSRPCCAWNPNMKLLIFQLSSLGNPNIVFGFISCLFKERQNQLTLHTKELQKLSQSDGVIQFERLYNP